MSSQFQLASKTLLSGVARRPLLLVFFALLAFADRPADAAEDFAPRAFQMRQDGATGSRRGDIQDMALKGRVLRLRVLIDGKIAGLVEFDVTGKPVQPAGGGLTIVVGPDGSRTEVQLVAGCAAWGGPFGHGVSFDCQGAAIARTVTDPSGVQLHTLFEDNQGRLISRIDYTSDPNGRLSAAVQRHILFGGAMRPVPPEKGDLLAQLPEFARTNVSFTDDGDVKSMVGYLAGAVVVRAEYAYDVDRRLVSVHNFDQPGGKEGISKYEYLATDAVGNWITRRMTSPGGTVTTEVREITYYP